MTTIEWTQETWNPTVGCSKVSEGCRNCYAIRQAHRNAAIATEFTKRGNNTGRLAYYQGLTERRGDTCGSTRTEWTGQVSFVPEALEIPIKRRKATKYFVNSMSDLFHPVVTDEQLDQVFAVMALTPQHTYQCLTKRPERMLVYLKDRDRHGKVLLASKGNQYIPGGMYPLAPYWPLPNLWLGVTCENQKTADERIPLLLQTPAAVRFLSVEPQLEAISFRPKANDSSHAYELLCAGIADKPQMLEGIDWVICGGESGVGARPFDLAWARSLRDQCQSAGVAFFMKQGGSNPIGDGADGMTGKGNDFEQLPSDLQIREMPVGAIA